MRVTEPSLRKKIRLISLAEPKPSKWSHSPLYHWPQKNKLWRIQGPTDEYSISISMPLRKFHLSLHDPSLLAFITWSTSWFVLSRIGLVDVQIMPYLSNSLDQYSLARFFEGYRRYWDQPQVIHWVYLHPILAMTKWLSPLHALRRQCRVLQ